MVEAKDSFKRSLRIEFDAYGIIIIKRASLLISWMTNDHLFFKISSLSFCPHYLDSTRMFLHASLWLVSCIQTCVFSLQAQASSIVFFYPADRNNADREKKNGSTWYRMTFISFGYGKTVDGSKRVAHNKPSHLSTSSSRRVVGVRSILYAQRAFSF